MSWRLGGRRDLGASPCPPNRQGHQRRKGWNPILLTRYLARLAKSTIMAVVLAAVAWPAAADWRDEYRRGREAFDNGQWSEVVAAMRAAITERSEERSGSGFLGRRYTPRFYLGVALAELGDCRQAIRFFEESESLGQIQQTVDSRAVVQRKEACQQQVDAAARSALASARRAVEEADRARQALEDLPQSLGAQWQAGEPSLVSMQDRAEGLLRQARQRLDQAAQQASEVGLDEVRRLASQAVSAFRAVATEARNRSVAQAQREVADARSSLTESIASAQRSLRTVRDLAPYPTELGKRVSALKTAVDQADTRGRDATSTEAEALMQAIADAQDALATAARRPPRRLLDATERFVSGDWLGALEALDGVRSRERRARSQVCILRAAAAWSLVELTLPEPRMDDPAVGGPDEPSDAPGGAEGVQAATAATSADSPTDGTATDAPQTVEQATDGETEPPAPTPPELLAAAIEGCRALDPLPEPDKAFFSPRFLAFFQQALAVPGDEEAGGEEAVEEDASTTSSAGAQP